MPKESSQGELRDVACRARSLLRARGVGLGEPAALRPPLIDSGRARERAMAECGAALQARKIRSAAQGQLRSGADARRAVLVAPLRRPISADLRRAAAVVLAGATRAPARAGTAGFAADHRIEPHALGVRDLLARTRGSGAKNAGLGEAADLASCTRPCKQRNHLPTAPPALEAASRQPSGGALAANRVMVAALARIGEAARFSCRRASRAIAQPRRPGLADLVCVEAE